MSLRAILNDPVEPTPIPTSVPTSIRSNEPQSIDSYPRTRRSRSPSIVRDDRSPSEVQYVGKDRNSYDRVRYHRDEYETDYPAYGHHNSTSGRPSEPLSSIHSPVHSRRAPIHEQPPPHTGHHPHRRDHNGRDRGYEVEEHDAYAPRSHSRASHAREYPPAYVVSDWQQNGSARTESAYEANRTPVSNRVQRTHATSLKDTGRVPEEQYHSKKRASYDSSTPREYLRDESRNTHHGPPDSPPVSPLADADLNDGLDQYMGSSDLSDNEEVWSQEMSHYVLETAKRQRQVELFFEESCVGRNNEVAHAMSNKYSSRLARIPMNGSTRHGSRHVYEGNRLMLRSPSPDFRNPNGLALDPRHTSHGHYPDHRRYQNEAAARALEEEYYGDGPSTVDHRLYDARKRGAAMTASDASGDEREHLQGPYSKKRRVEDTTGELIDDIDRNSLVGDDPHSISISIRGPDGSKGKGKAISTSGGGSDIGAKPRRKPGPKKKDPFAYLQQDLGQSSSAVSVAGDVTPTPSGPPSPTLSATLIYELGETVPPMKKAKKVDDQVMAKRLIGLEESQKKVWLYIARRDVGKVYKHHFVGHQARHLQASRTASMAAAAAKKISHRTTRTTKDVQTKAKRLMREMMVFWKKNEKEERELRKRAEKEADSRAKEEEERREATRQARKLEFLISQTELYSHFVGNKLKTAEIEGESNLQAVPKGAEGEEAAGDLVDIDFDNEDTTNLHAHARRNAQEAIALAKSRAAEFDSQVALERKTAELAKAQAHLRDEEDKMDTGEKPAGALVDLDSDELNFQNPTSLTGPLTIHQPKMLQAQLKEYQLKGLNWLGTLYEQGINGILADEMGLGKTVQSISLLAHLAEAHNIWGPFLVVVPSSTLHNWQQELARFVPELTTLPYWGSPKDRARLRNDWRKRGTGFNRDSPFHVLVTSYSLVIQDQQYLQRIKWQYMILDEAQNIKNSSSARWKTLLSLQCRNRLLLTGTPIQNNMQELWALLHFIMPSLFDSHDEFNEWFSKDIENAASDSKGSKLSEHQLRRLHMILKPFMLRRVKRHVQNELSEKIEIDIYVTLSARQRALYRAIRANLSVADIIEKASHIGDAEATRTLMNLLMQFRKVCNHPELFDRADVVAPYSFSDYGCPNSIAREGDFVNCFYSTRNPMDMAVPNLFYLDGVYPGVVTEEQPPKAEGWVMHNLFNIWQTDWIQRSLEENANSPFNFAPLLGMTSSEAHKVHSSSTVERMILAAKTEQRCREEDQITLDPFFEIHEPGDKYRMSSPSLRYLERAEQLPALSDIGQDIWKQSYLSRQGLRCYVPPATAPHTSLYSSHRMFEEKRANVLEAPQESLALYGLPPQLCDVPALNQKFREKMPTIPLSGLIGASPAYELPLSCMQVPEAQRLIIDSAKLARLDALLHELKAGDHRVLIYFQMTRMMDLMEEYLIYRQYKYVRLDGGTKIEDRRDLVMDWQTRPDIFIFLLSTRAGGLGINLTAADTVVFYDHDWNPSNDAQAMDRAHRLGQTRQVTVYRLITKGTIDERIVQLARVKKDVQDIVVGNKQFQDVTKPSEIVSLLLNDDELANLERQGVEGLKSNDFIGSKASAAVREVDADDDDNFFGSGAFAPQDPVINENGEEDESQPYSNGNTRGRKRGSRGGRGGGGKPGPRRVYKKKAAMQDA